MQVSLSFVQRVLFLNALEKIPMNITEMRLKNKCVDLLGIQDGEREEYGIEQQGDQLNIKNAQAASQEKGFEIPDRCYFLVREHLQALSNAKEITKEIFPLADKMLDE